MVSKGIKGLHIHEKFEHKPSIGRIEDLLMHGIMCMPPFPLPIRDSVLIPLTNLSGVKPHHFSFKVPFLKKAQMFLKVL